MASRHPSEHDCQPADTRPQVLLVDDSRSVMGLLKNRIEIASPARVLTASTLAGASELLAEPHNVAVAVAGLCLADAPNGEVVDFMHAQKVPVVVLTGNMDEQVRETILAKRVIDYVVKRQGDEVDYVVELVQRLCGNHELKVLVVDDGRTSRLMIRRLLEAHNYQVLEAEDGVQALEVLEEHPDVTMVLSDYQMPRMDGAELITRIRRRWTRNDMAIIGLSAQDDPTLSARLLKAGASDYLTKPFIEEEFYCRVHQNADLVRSIRAMRDASRRDYLTGLYNRRYLHDTGAKLYANARRGNLHLVAAMLDLDHFKHINDTYGHQAGDLALQHVAKLLRQSVRASDMLARYGGEEFCVLLANGDAGQPALVLERVRQVVADTPLDYDGQRIEITLSIGATGELGESFEAMLDAADHLLYEAKAAGRNRIVLGDGAGTD
ncbi:MAG TPA: diguanylate cyclase [Thioalkalivibrio sp.]|nr:diguanylate cyclase [Thioalkalivibrio sp.]